MEKINRQVVFDIETNGLLKTVSKIWIIVTCDLTNNDYFVWSDSFTVHSKYQGTIDQGIRYLRESAIIIAHNGVMYDIPAILKIKGIDLFKECKVFDTMIMSQVQNYYRFSNGRHSLAVWGEFLGYPKQEHDEWDRFSEEMVSRCFSDVEINVKVYKYLLRELNSRSNKNILKIGLSAEHYTSIFVAKSILRGWDFNIPAAKELLNKLEAEMNKIKLLIEPKLRKRVKPFDKADDVKRPAWVANGHYAKRTYEWFGVSPESGLEENGRPIQGDYCRVEYITPDIGSMEAVKDLLYSIGWKPTEWNYSKETKKPTTPKLSSDSLEPLGEIGQAIDNFYTYRSRHSVVTGWLEEIQNSSTGKLHGDCFVIGTPTFRSRHEIIANIPSDKAAFGGEIRELFTVPKGYKMVGVDSKGNQNRALCHYLNNNDYTKKVLEGDIHLVNAAIMHKYVPEVDPNSKKVSKPAFYA